YINGASSAVCRNHLALEIVDRVDWRVFQDEKLSGIVVLKSILELARDDAKVFHAGVVDGEGESRIGEKTDLDLIGRQRCKGLRRSLEADWLHHIGVAEMPGKPWLLEQDGGPMDNRDRVGLPDAHRLVAAGRPHEGHAQKRNEAGRRRRRQGSKEHSSLANILRCAHRL